MDTIDENNKGIENEYKEEDEQKEKLINEIRGLESKMGSKKAFIQTLLILA